MPTKPLERICYVEDDEDIQRIVRMSLERVGKMKVEIVGDPMIAIDAIVEFRPDLVMLDWMMPGMDGPTLFRKLKEYSGNEEPSGSIHDSESECDGNGRASLSRRARRHFEALFAEGPARAASRALEYTSLAPVWPQYPRGKDPRD